MPEVTRDPLRAAARLAAGELVAMPTETVYGLAADARNEDAIAKVYALKGRPASNPLIVHVGDPDWLTDWATEVPENARALIAAFWPGPLTLVLPARVDVPRSVTANQDSVALRQPDHPLCLALLRAFGRAVVAPSANRYMALSPTEATHVAAQFPNSDLLILDGGPCRVGVESTIVSVLPDEPPRLLRPGMITRAALERVLGAPLADTDAEAPRVPGQHHRHYAPRTRTLRFSLEERPDATDDPRTGWLFCGSPFAVAGPALDLGNDAGAHAQRLYAALYRLDHADIERICVQMPPETDDWQAVRDRITRASAPWTGPLAGAL